MNPFRSRSIKRIYLKLIRHSGSPEYVARGVAIGLFTAFFIPFSFQMVVALFLSLQFRAARISAMLLTWITNPFTIPFIYPLQCYIGSKMIHVPLTYSHIREQLAAIARTPSTRSITDLGSEVLLSFFVGGLLFGGIAAALGYYATLPWITRHRLKRELRKERCRKRAIILKQSESGNFAE